VDFQAAQLSKYIHRSSNPEQHPFGRANVYFHGLGLTFTLYRQANYPGWDRHPIATTIGCKAFRWQFSPLVQVLNQFSAILHIGTIIHLELHVQLGEDRQLWGAGDVEWLNFLHQFPAMRALHVPRYVPAFIFIVLTSSKNGTSWCLTFPPFSLTNANAKVQRVPCCVRTGAFVLALECTPLPARLSF
jgi:hypothetical protein